MRSSLFRRSLGTALALAALASAPAAAQVAVLDDAVQERAVRAGEAYEGVLRVRNTTAAPLEVKVYLTDYAFSADGTTDYPAAGSLPRSSARWLSLGTSALRLAAGETAEVPYRVAVPSGAADGSYWTMVMVEPLTAGDAEATPAAAPRGRVGLRAKMRFGVQMATHVGAPASGAELAFAEPRAVAAGGRRALEVDVRNPGARAVRPALRLELFDAEGNAVARVEAVRGLLYPGTSLRHSFDLGALPAGTYRALVVGDAGGDRLFGARYDLAL
jgi:hypothetical protein